MYNFSVWYKDSHDWVLLIVVPYLNHFTILKFPFLFRKLTDSFLSGTKHSLTFNLIVVEKLTL